MADVEPVIRLYCDTSVCLTTEEYEEMVRELQIKQMTGTLTKGDTILATVLHYMNWRYHEALRVKEIRSGRYVSPRE